MQTPLPSQPPLITIISVVYNAAPMLEQTIKSVISQSYPNTEYLIVDGGSVDGTLGIIDAYKEHIDAWVSEQDSGISEAMNKGVKLAQGDFICFLHAGDSFYQTDALANAAAYFDAEHAIYLCTVAFGEQLKRITPHNFGLLTNLKMGFCHQGVLCARHVFKNIGKFDENYKISMDYDFFLRAYRNTYQTKCCALTLSKMNGQGISSRQDWPGLLTRFMEEQQAHLKNCHNKSLWLFYLFYWPIYLSYRKIKHYSKHCFGGAQ